MVSTCVIRFSRPQSHHTTQTREDEYLGSRSVWPQPEECKRSDIFDALKDISSPTLLLHGKCRYACYSPFYSLNLTTSDTNIGADDDICPISQSRIVFHELNSRAIPTALLTYPGEKHGFGPRCRQDVDRRVLSWFLHYLPI